MTRPNLRRYLPPCIAAIILALILTPTVDASVRRMQEENAVNMVRIAGAAVAEAIDRWYDERVKDLELLAKQEALQSDDLDLIQSILIDFQRKDNAIQVCVLFDYDGHVLTSSAIPPGQTNDSAWPWFQAAVQGNTSVSGVHQSPITGRNVVAILTPVRSPDGRVVKVVGSIIELMSLQYAVADSALASAGQAYLVDPSGQIVALGHYGGKPTRLEGRAQTTATADLATGKSGSGMYTGVANTKVCGCYTGLDMPGWGAVVEQDVETTMKQMAPLRRAAAGASIAFSGLVALAGWFVVTGGKKSGSVADLEPLQPAPPPEPSLESDPQPAEAVLSPREREILKYVASGMTNKEIANSLYLSEHTVKAHLHSILAKLHLENRTQAAAYSLQHLKSSGSERP